MKLGGREFTQEEIKEAFKRGNATLIKLYIGTMYDGYKERLVDEQHQKDVVRGMAMAYRELFRLFD